MFQGGYEMKAAELTKKCREITAELVQAVKKANNDEQILNYLEFCSRFHNYSLHNRFLIWAFMPDARFVAGFRTWARMGRHVKKDEKGIPIFAPMTIKVKKDKTDREDETQETLEDSQPEVITRFKVVYVWDVSQTEGDPLPEAPDVMAVYGNADSLLLALETVVTAKGIELAYVEDFGKAAGVSSKGRIEILSSLDTAQRFSVLAHEFAHELLHGHWERAILSRKVKELEAEATAYVVLRHFGLQCKAPEYLALYRVEEVDIMGSLDRIVSTASGIIQAIEANLTKASEPDEDPGGYGDIGRWRRAVGC
ncbi:MAG: DUF1738 domain-containing protein [Deltaproteobacteria bacterium]|nr:DUF1738 domain-containing protein [Deltaproteobacteria bacterium]